MLKVTSWANNPSPQSRFACLKCDADGRPRTSTAGLDLIDVMVIFSQEEF
jgi:hypothetical protein